MPIILTNASRNITLSKILMYQSGEEESYPIKRPVGTTPRIDLNARTMSPPTRVIQTVVNKTDRDTLIAMRRDHLLITINDGNEYSGTPLMVLTKVDHEPNYGTNPVQYRVTLTMLQSSNLS